MTDKSRDWVKFNGINFNQQIEDARKILGGTPCAVLCELRSIKISQPQGGRVWHGEGVKARGEKLINATYKYISDQNELQTI